MVSITGVVLYPVIWLASLVTEDLLSLRDFGQIHNHRVICQQGQCVPALNIFSFFCIIVFPGMLGVLLDKNVSGTSGFFF